MSIRKWKLFQTIAAKLRINCSFIYEKDLKTLEENSRFEKQPKMMSDILVAFVILNATRFFYKGAMVLYRVTGNF